MNEEEYMIYPKEPIKYDLYDEAIANNEELWTIHNVHDPALIKDGDTYYVFSTDAKFGGKPTGGIQIRKSKDLIEWEWVGHAFDQIPEKAFKWTGALGLWAPDVAKYRDTYFLYYAASQFGKNQSFIGVATSKHIEGPWVDQGEVIKTEHGIDTPNAIDPNITFDDQGRPWMVYGSFFGGIYLCKIDPETGKLAEKNEGKLIARRHKSVEAAVEGPYIVYHPDLKKYYLFVSYDSLFRDYNIRVARADFIEGPYLDFNGNKMTDIEIDPNEIGMKVLGGYKFDQEEGWIGPGHNSVLCDNGNYFICHHARGERTKKHHGLHIRKIVWTEDGWPLASPERFSGEIEQAINPKAMEGLWDILIQDKHENNMISSRKYEFLSNGRISNDKNSYWTYKNDNLFELAFHDTNTKLDIIVLASWDFECWNPTLVFTGKDKNGVVAIGKKRKND
jgi:arabinan endo-1,5-alpha-L-arabinosidase